LAGFRSVVAAAVAATLVLGACVGGSTDDAGSGGSGSSESEIALANDADVSFAQNMIPHHRQAVEMAMLAEGRTDTAAVLDIASRIRAAQDPEIEQMRAWLAEWGSDEMSSEMEGMNRRASGMLYEDEMSFLASASGDEFDRQFVDRMFRHHKGAIDMARAVLDDGADPEVRTLADAIISTRSAEIDEMLGLGG
jgi:uncharacterized protein (DUF305 family)